jgi:ribosome maturation factor RimP
MPPMPPMPPVPPAAPGPSSGDDVDVIRALAEPIVADAGLALLEVSVKHGRGAGLVKVVVDRKGGVPLEACQAVSRALSAELDAEDPVEGRYALEVTSPGIDWPLGDQAAFDRVEGRDVVVQHRVADGRVLEASGTVVEAAADAVVIAGADDRVRIAYDDIVKAKQQLPW